MRLNSVFMITLFTALNLGCEGARRASHPELLWSPQGAAGASTIHSPTGGLMSSGLEAGAEAGTAAGAEAGAEADPETNLWEVQADERPLTVRQRALWSEAVYHAWPFTESPEGRDTWLVERAQRLALVDELGESPLRVSGELGGRPRGVVSLESAEQGLRHLIATPAALWLSPEASLTEAPWQLSPISESLGGAWAISVDAQGRLSALNDRGLSLWSEGILTRLGWVALEGVTRPELGLEPAPRQASVLPSGPLSGPAAELASPEGSEGAHEVADEGGVWLWVEPDLNGERAELALVAHGRVWRHPSWRSEQAPCVAHRGAWGVLDGQLWGGLQGTAWRPVHLSASGRELSVQRLWCGPPRGASEGLDSADRDELWLLAEQSLWRLRLNPAGPSADAGAGDQLRGVSLSGSWRGGALSAQGTPVLWGDQGLISLETERSAAWIALDGAELNERAHRFSLSFDDASALEASRWGVRRAGEGAEGEPEFELDLDPLNPLITLTNLDLTEGDFELYAELSYQGGERVSARLPLISAPLTRWGLDIAPLHEARCASCHSGTGARDLSGPAQWFSNIDDIIFVTRMQSMPIGAPALSAAEVDLIERWKLAGGLE